MGFSKEKERYEDGIPEQNDSIVRVRKAAVVGFKTLQEAMGNIPPFLKL